MRSRAEVLEYRGRVPMVFQDPYGSLSPVYRVSHGIWRALKLHRPMLSRSARERVAVELVESVGLAPGGDFLFKYPYELSGGQRQRIGFAQALACNPELILADEPVSMLDVSVRIGVLNLMATLRRELRISFLYITHDIASARYVADRLLVMYAGRVAESGPVDDVLAHPKHPYTQLLVSAVPDPRAPVSLPATSSVAEPPRVVDPGEGCRFRQRCPYAIEECTALTPRLRLLRPGHDAACHVATSDMADPVQPIKRAATSS
jgi:peptide/nickel transport system ATP-binding protein